MNHCLQCECEIPDSMLFCERCTQRRPDPVPVLLSVESVEQPRAADDVPPVAEQGWLLGDAGSVDSTAVRAGAVTSARPAQAIVNGRELLMIAAAFVVGGIGTFEFLSASSRAPEPVRAQVAAAPATERHAPVTRQAVTPRWNSSNRRWLGDQRNASAFELLSNNEVHVWQRNAHPTLVVRCMSKRTEAFVFIESAAQIEPQDDRRSVRLRFDDGPEVSDRWLGSDDHDALFAPDGARFVDQLLGAQTIRFGYTPHNAPPVVAEFNVRGFREVFEPLSGQCGRTR